MLKRKIERKLNDYFSRDPDKILVIDGARQVGKSYIIRETAKRYFPNYIEINMVEDSEGDKLFKDATSLKSFYLTLGAVAGRKLGNYDDTIIFLDEIQEYPHLLTLLKFLKSDRRYRFIVSGSQLGITLFTTTSIPMGAIDVVEMYPLDFEEFLWANGINDEFIGNLKDIVSSHGAFQAPRPPVSLLTLLLWHRFQICKAFTKVKNHISDCERYFARAKNISESGLD